MFWIIDFKNGVKDRANLKQARKTLEDAIPKEAKKRGVLNQAEFSRFKATVELYLQDLDLEVIRSSDREARNQGKRGSAQASIDQTAAL